MTGQVLVLDKSVRPRGRPRSFVTAEVLSKIRACFASRGYGGTSISDLAEATGLAPPSLYNAFGDKRAMFIKALDAEYAELSTRLLSLNAVTPLPVSIKKFLEAVTTAYTHGSTLVSPGIAFGAAVAEAAIDAEVRSRLQRFHDALNSAAEKLLEKEGQPTAAYLLVALAISLCVGAQSGRVTLSSVNANTLATLISRT